MITPRENLKLIYQHKMPQYMPLADDFDLLTPGAGGVDFINECPSFPGTHKDWFGQSWTFEPLFHASAPTPGCYLLYDIRKWKETITFPDIDNLDWCFESKKDTANWHRETKMSRVTLSIGMWERLYSIMPFELALSSLITEPEACYEFFQAIAEHKIRIIRKIIEYYRPDILSVNDDYGASQCMFMSPEVWRQLLKPHLKRIVDYVKASDVIYEHHNCGYFHPIINDMLEIGIEATNPVNVSNDISVLKKHYGDRLVVVGGFDHQLIDSPCSSIAGIREHVRNTMDILAPGGGFIPRLGGFSEGKAVANDEIKEYSANFYGPRPY